VGGKHGADLGFPEEIDDLLVGENGVGGRGLGEDEKEGESNEASERAAKRLGAFRP